MVRLFPTIRMLGGIVLIGFFMGFFVLPVLLVTLAPLSREERGLPPAPLGPPPGKHGRHGGPHPQV